MIEVKLGDAVVFHSIRHPPSFEYYGTDINTGVFVARVCMIRDPDKGIVDLDLIQTKRDGLLRCDYVYHKDYAGNDPDRYWEKP